MTELEELQKAVDEQIKKRFESQLIWLPDLLKNVYEMELQLLKKLEELEVEE